MKISRRDFATGLSLAPFAAACADTTRDEGSTPFRHAAAPAARALSGDDPTSLASRISLNVYSFNIALDSYVQGRSGYTVSLTDLIPFCHDNGIPAIDATGYYWWNTTTKTGYPAVPPAADVKAFVDEAARSGIAISGTGVQNNFASPYAAQRASDLRLVRAWCEVAAALGAPVLRVFAGPVPQGYGWDQIASWMCDCLAQCAEYGKEFGVKIGVQNHGDMLKTANQCIEVLRRVDSEWLGAVNDTGYFLTPDPYDDIARLMPYTITLQVKESVRAVKNFQAAATALARFVGILRGSTYTGWLPVETLQALATDYDPRQAVPAFVGALRCAMNGNCPT